LGRRALVVRFLWSLVLVSAFITPLIGILAAAVPNIVDAPFVPERPGWTPLAVRFFENPGTTQSRYSLRLRLENPETLLRHQELWVLFATYGTKPRLESARLAVRGTGCIYETKPGAKLRNNQVLAFFRGSTCDPPPPRLTGDFELIVDLAHPGDLAVWTFQPPASGAARDSNSIYLQEIPGHEAAQPVLRGRYIDRYPDTGHRRIDLLNYLWQISARPTWIWWLLGSVATLLMLGALLFPVLPRRQTGHAGGLLIRTFASTLCFALALGLLYVVLVPPFQAPDESTHFVTYTAATGADHMVRDVTAWGELIHFERIRFHSDERFRPVHIGRPLEAGWQEGPIDPAVRSSAAWELWIRLAPYLTSLSPPRQFLALRAVNAVVFSLAVALAVALLVYASDAPYPQLGSIAFFFVPTLPFFTMHVSNHATLVTAYVLVSSAVLMLVLDGARSHIAGAILGLGMALALSTSRSSIPMLVLVVCVSIARAVLGTHRGGHRGPLTSAFAFWLGMWIGLSATVVLAAAPDYGSMLLRVISQSNQPFVQDLPPLEWLMRPGRLVMLFAAGGLAVEWGAAGLRSLAGGLMRPWSRTAVRFVTLAVAAALSLGAIGSLFVTYPQLYLVQPDSTIQARVYARDVLLVALTSFRIGEPDYLLSTTFWGGFGWLDTFPDLTLLSLLPVSSGVALVALILAVGRSGDGRRFLWLAAVATGFAGSMAAYALSVLAAFRYSPNVHGRYLIGLYLCVLAVCWSAPILWAPRTNISWNLPGRLHISIPWPVLFLPACAAIHAYALSVILTRYF
jgi:hypothetical protein